MIQAQIRILVIAVDLVGLEMTVNLMPMIVYPLLVKIVAYAKMMG